MGQSSTYSQKSSGLRFAIAMAKESSRYRRLYGRQCRSTTKSNSATLVWAVFRDVEAADPRPPRPPRPRDARPRGAGPLPVAAEEDLVRPPPLFPHTIAWIWGLCGEWVK